MTELEKLQAEHAAMGETIARMQAEASKAVLLNRAAMFVPASDGYTFWYINSQPEGYLLHEGYSVPEIKYAYAPKFRTKEHAEAIAFARSIEDQMRAQPGCVVAEDRVEQFIIRFLLANVCPEPVARRVVLIDDKLEFGQFGVFDTQANLEAAIKTVGAENLIRAAKAKVGIY